MGKIERYFLALWFLLNVMLGLFLVRDFGVSYDEPDYYLYAQNSVDAYGSFFALAYTPSFGPNDLPNYGPAFIIFPELVLRFLRVIFRDVFAPDIWHFSYFVLFQLGGLCLYLLARRWFQSWSAWGVLLLYTSQPLLWGHAFINPKDIPFLSFFLFTLWSGFRLADSVAAPGTRKLSLPPFRVRDSLPYLRSPHLILAGVLLGMTMSIRLLGPLPGLIVILYFVWTLGPKWLPVTTAYVLTAAVVMFLTWPALWPNPIDHWMDSLVLMVNFPWPGRILFNGQFYDPDGLPMSYLPVLLNIQLTETLLILMYVGLAVLGYAMLHRRAQPDLWLTVTLGGLLPLLGLTLSRATLYDNFRQLLFLLPALILLAGLALEALFTWLQPAALRSFVLLVLTLPGLYAIAQLHPYPYAYYNSLVGGTGGASRKFELDYWCTSYREAALWLNKRATNGAIIAGNGPDYLLDLYARQDLVLRPQEDPDEELDYFVVTSRYNQDLALHSDANVVYSIGRDGALLAVVKQLSP